MKSKQDIQLDIRHIQEKLNNLKSISFPKSVTSEERQRYQTLVLEFEDLKEKVANAGAFHKLVINLTCETRAFFNKVNKLYLAIKEKV
jgi:hypothetical protein